MEIVVGFLGGARVDATVRGHVVRTDQSTAHGGADVAPQPFELFLASIATCGGYYAQRFCAERGIATDGLGLVLRTHSAEGGAGKRVARIELALTLPAGFPEKYRPAILRAIDQCAVKRHIVEPPQFELTFAALAPPPSPP